MTTMDRKRLSIALSRVPDHPEPKSRLEQVRTPGPIAADLLLEAHAAGDIEGRRVLDLGCGTGVLAVGAALLGAERVVAVDIDAGALAVARQAADEAGVADRIVYLCQDLIAVQPESLAEAAGGALDTAVMNPPFGADLGSRAAGGDRVFLSLAFRATPHVYSLHAASTERFLVAFARDAGFEAARADVVAFPLPGRHAHHRDLMRSVSVGVYRFTRRDEVREAAPQEQ